MDAFCHPLDMLAMAPRAVGAMQPAQFQQRRIAPTQREAE